MAETPLVQHDPPSLPASPLPKRTKRLEPSLSAAPQPAPTPTPDSRSQSAFPLPSVSAMASAAPSLPSLLPSLDTAPPPLQIQLLSSTAKAPTRGSAFAAGYDLYASQATVVPSRGKVLVETDISIAVPANTYGRVAPRSGLASKHFIDTGAGVIDADYRGPVKVLLFNHSDKDFEVAVGERVAQLIVERIYTPEVVVVEKLGESVRGAGGFGSTGGFGGLLAGSNGA